jgi:beta-lactamase class A
MMNKLLFSVMLAGLFMAQAHAGNSFSWSPRHSAALQRDVDAAVNTTLNRFAPASLRPDEFAATVIVLDDANHPLEASYRGNAQIYPASVIKLFYLAAVHRWLEDGRLADTPELRRALRDMIVDSSNDATSYIVDVLTGTTSGPELPQPEIGQWWEKRNAVNHYFTSLGFTNINASKKPWEDRPYGRESQATNLFTPRRNWLTTDATARLMAEIATGEIVTPDRCRQMMDLLQRDPAGSNKQARGYTAMGMPPGTKLWSKAGWTDEARHDCAYLELPDGRKLVLTIFTLNHANDHEILPALVKSIIDNLPPKEPNAPSP